MSTAFQRGKWRMNQQHHRDQRRAQGWRAPTTTRPPTPARRRVYNARYRARRKVRQWREMIGQ